MPHPHESIDLLTDEVMQYTRQTKSLATAIACMLSGSLPADHGERNNIVADFVTLIEDLASRAETQAGCLMESILTRNQGGHHVN